MSSQYELTINIKRAVGSVKLKKKAPRAISEIKKAVNRLTHCKNIRIDGSLNQFIWDKGIRTPPKCVRIRVEHRVEKDRSYANVFYVPVIDFSGLKTVKKEIK
ncbi:Ribosomal protein L31e like protein [Aduncisulcus paluster]|uniref:Ribosomal protein L31e like protein n=1 Tax=Aduncisulcus paluster TaxID=2918883 RepID=A0ABQ5KMP9_9EUKA|nr:Ribosomal protein L31e like protein [Aduncisulcus paluster]|eukprot:gnl/Carplike_NY0171/50_a71_12634.p2 GENE.gnl/Carplike_NY0171/50_a71_12634~~gnl/Carplike_NY0171/50_a71_12634.p2  ORF type:complete len:103 (-),score=25.34 gnl/Carplike_NY0171/50_a71_12634:88-396(-)